MRKSILYLILCIFSFAFSLQSVEACTNYLVSRGASADGSAMVSYAADSHVRYGELYWKPAADWPQGTMVTLYDRGTAKPLGQIPQASHTYQVIGFMNEHQVAIGESTFGGRGELFDSTGVVDYGSLMFLALQRSKTAREAIKVIAGLMEQYGYASTGESFSIGDPNEVWIMELIGKGVDMQIQKKTQKQFNASKGAVWVAMKVPEGYISSHANASRITTFPLADGKISITSKELDKIFNSETEVVYAYDVITFARNKGYFTGIDTDFSFSAAYAPTDFDAARFCDIRVWSFFNRVSKGMDQYFDYVKGDLSKERIPLFIKPDRELTPRDLMASKRNHLEGTPLDMAKDAGAGPFGTPYRWRPLTWEYNGKEFFNERATATQQTGFSFIAQMRNWLPDPVGGIFWFGVDDAATTVYVPFYCGITRVPEVFAEGNGDMLTWSDTSGFWTFNRVAHFAYLFYNRVIGDIRKVQEELESKFAAFTPAIDVAAAEYWKTDPVNTREFLTDFSGNMAMTTVSRWKELGDFLMVKYMDGNVKQEKEGRFIRNPWNFPPSPSFPGYPEGWKKNVVEDTGAKLAHPK
jgi:dipeptidase